MLGQAVPRWYRGGTDAVPRRDRGGTANTCKNSDFYKGGTSTPFGLINFNNANGGAISEATRARHGHMLSLINIVVKISSQMGWGVAWTCHDRFGPEIFQPGWLLLRLLFPINLLGSNGTKSQWGQMGAWRGAKNQWLAVTSEGLHLPFLVAHHRH